ncbi:MAG TPA: flagellar motor protein MotB [Terriglobales bacterium]|jgi:chemotaxis protein MotB|nr:flagellar motor protein MotB [Terriglobales bacterium]
MPAPPIIIIKKKGGHGGHHGGAWKVAYADFVTAMMALFIVLWLMNTSKPIQVAISGYFKDPSGTGKETGSQLSGKGGGSEAAQLNKETLSLAAAIAKPEPKQDMEKLKADLQESIRSIHDLDKLSKFIEMTVTSEGLRIELLESAGGTFFKSGSPELNKNGQEIASLLATELAKLPNHISVEGHTDAKPFVGKSSYSNWELSSDRGNAARRLMQESGLRGDQVSQVRGFADQRLRNPKNPLDASNRRISIIVQYLSETNTPGSAGENKSEVGTEKAAAPDAKTASKTTDKIVKKDKK